MSAWLHVIGIGDDGIAGLATDAVAALQNAQVIIGGTRHLNLVGEMPGQKQSWESPWTGVVSALRPNRGKPTAVLVSGDPLWQSAGCSIAQAFPAAEMRIYPNLSSFQLACTRMIWCMQDVETVTVHGRPVDSLLPRLAPGAKLIIMTSDQRDPGLIASMLAASGYGLSQLTVLGHLGGPDESRFEAIAQEWTGEVPMPALNIVCLKCKAVPDTAVMPRGPGLPDTAFGSFGNFTKSEIRAISLAALWPRRGALLWDIGAGSGSVSIEWIRAAPQTAAIAIEPLEERRLAIRANAERLGASGVEIVAGRAPEALEQLPPPDAVFIGGGLSKCLIAALLRLVKPQTRLVANAVTLESETILAGIQDQFGGELIRIAVQRSERIGSRSGWRPLMPVTQWRRTA